MMSITDECWSLTEFDELMLSRARKLEQGLKKWQNIFFIDGYIVNRYYQLYVGQNMLIELGDVDHRHGRQPIGRSLLHHSCSWSVFRLRAIRVLSLQIVYFCYKQCTFATNSVPSLQIEYFRYRLCTFATNSVLLLYYSWCISILYFYKGVLVKIL